jgi:hypothetical protein
MDNPNTYKQLRHYHFVDITNHNVPHFEYNETVVIFVREKNGGGKENEEEEQEEELENKKEK